MRGGGMYLQQGLGAEAVGEQLPKAGHGSDIGRQPGNALQLLRGKPA